MIIPFFGASYKGNNPIGSEPHPLTSFNFIFFLWSLVSKCSYTVGIGLSLIYVFWGGHKHQSTTLPHLEPYLSIIFHFSVNEGIVINSHPQVTLLALTSKSVVSAIVFHFLYACLSVCAYCNRLLTGLFFHSCSCTVCTSQRKASHFPLSLRAFPCLSCHSEWKSAFFALAVRSYVMC